MWSKFIEGAFQLVGRDWFLYYGLFFNIAIYVVFRGTGSCLRRAYFSNVFKIFSTHKEFMALGGCVRTENIREDNALLAIMARLSRYLVVEHLLLVLNLILFLENVYLAWSLLWLSMNNSGSGEVQLLSLCLYISVTTAILLAVAFFQEEKADQIVLRLKRRHPRAIGRSEVQTSLFS